MQGLTGLIQQGLTGLIQHGEGIGEEGEVAGCVNERG
jgi:hypothetical protein